MINDNIISPALCACAVGDHAHFTELSWRRPGGADRELEEILVFDDSSTP